MKHQFSNFILRSSVINFKHWLQTSHSINTLLYYFHFYCLGLLTKMLANLPVEIVLLICEYPEPKDLGQLAWTNKRMMQIIRRHLPIALEIAFKREILLYRRKIFIVYERELILVFSTLWKWQYWWRKNLSVWFAY